MSSRNQNTTARSEVVRQRRSQPERKVTIPESKPESRPSVSNVWQPVNRQPVQPIRHQSVPVSRYNTPARSMPHTAVSPRKINYKVAANGVETRMLSLPTIPFQLAVGIRHSHRNSHCGRIVAHQPHRIPGERHQR